MNAPTQTDIIQHININDIKPDPDQPRMYYDQAALQELADDIKQHGIIEPIIFFINNDEKTILAGERRWRSAQLAGLETVPCLLRSAPDPLERLFTQVSENYQRENLNPIELARFFDTLVTKFDVQVKDIGTILEQHGLKKMERSYISNTRRLLQLPSWAQDMIQAGTLNSSHGKHLLEGIKSSKVMAQAKRFLQKRKTPPTAGEVSDRIESLFREHHINVTGWNRANIQVFFDAKTECKGCESSKCFSDFFGDSDRYCLDQKCFDKKNAAGEQQQRKEMEKAQKRMEQLKAKVTKKGATSKDAKRIDDSRLHGRIERTEQHLDNYLVQLLQAHIKKDKTTRYQLMLWMAAGAPGNYGRSMNWNAQSPGSLDIEACEYQDEIGADTELPELDHGRNDGINMLLKKEIRPLELEQSITSIGIAVMSRDNLRALAHHCKIKLKDYRIDAEYLDIKQKQELIDTTPEKVIKKIGQDAWHKLCKGRTDTIKETLLEHADTYGVPVDLQAMYKESK